MSEPIVQGLFSDNGELTGWCLISRDTGETLCSEEDAEKIASLESQLKEKDKEIELLNDELNDKTMEVQVANTSIDLLSSQLDDANERIKDLGNSM